MATERLEYEILAKEASFLRSMERAAKSARTFDDELERLTEGAIRFNREAKRYVDASGQFVSKTRVKALAAQNLARAQEGAAASTGRFNASLSSLTFALNDATSFQHSFSQGVLALSNNIPGLLAGLGTAGASTGLAAAIPYVGLAATAAATAFVLFSDNTKKAKEETDKLKESARQAADELFRIKQDQPIFEAKDLEQAKAFRDILKGMRDESQAALRATRPFTFQSGLFQGFTIQLGWSKAFAFRRTALAFHLSGLSGSFALKLASLEATAESR